MPPIFAAPFRPLACGLSLLVILVCSERAVQSAEDPPEVVGARLEENGQWLEAAAFYRELALAGTVIQPAWVQRAIVAYLTADRAAAADSFVAEVLRRDPKFAEVLFFHAEGQRVTMRYEEAEGTYRRLLEQRPGHVKAQLSLGHVLSRLGRPEEAIPFFEAFLRAPIGPEFLQDQAELDYARALRTLGRASEALDRLTRLLERKPYHPQALTECARLLARLKRPELANELRRTVSELSKRGHLQTTDDGQGIVREGSVNVRVKARIALHAEDRFEFLTALEGFREVVRETPGEPEPIDLLARLLFRLKRYTECVEIIDSLGAATVDLYLLRFRAQVAAGHDEAALAGLDRLFHEESPLRKTPEAASILLAAVHNQLDTGRGLNVAARWLRTAVDIAPNDLDVLLARARLLLARGRADDALARLEKYPPEKRDGSSEYRRLRAIARGMKGDLRFARNELISLIRADAGNRQNFIGFAMVFANHLDAPGARQVLELGSRLGGRLEKLTEVYRALSETPLARCAALYRHAARLLIDTGDRPSAVDCLVLATALNQENVDAPLALGQLLAKPAEIFFRLQSYRTALARAPGDRRIEEGLVRAYAESGLRLVEAGRLADALAEKHPDAKSEALRELVRTKRKEFGADD